MEINEIEKKHPSFYQKFKEQFAKQTTEVEESESLTNFLRVLLTHCNEQWQSAKIKEMVDVYKKSVSLPKAPENMARYQSSLDNDLYKAMRALRDAQAWRAERRLNVATKVSDTKTD